MLVPGSALRDLRSEIPGDTAVSCFKAFIKRLTDDVLQRPTDQCLPSDDIETMREALKKLERGYTALNEASGLTDLGDAPPPNEVLRLYRAVFDLMSGAYFAGALGVIPKRAEKIFPSKAGKMSGLARREQRVWTKHAEELAKKIRGKQPEISKSALATEIASCWKLEDVNCPGHETLTKHISVLENLGTLPRRR